jgi:hypothetical protein
MGIMEAIKPSVSENTTPTQAQQIQALTKQSTGHSPLVQRSDSARKLAWCAGLKVLAETHNQTMAAEAAGVAYTTWMRKRERDPGFAAAVQVAMEKSTDALEYEARTRAVQGWEEVTKEDGKPTKTVTRKSDRLLEVLLKGQRPMYRDGAQVAIGGDARVVIVQPSGTSKP